jgi:hypothetical protein
MTKEHERLRMYRQGWVDGGGFRSYNFGGFKEYEDDYDDGFADAKRSFRRDIARKRKKLGLPPEAMVHTA